jgi:hypothetical protein
VKKMTRGFLRRGGSCRSLLKERCTGGKLSALNCLYGDVTLNVLLVPILVYELFVNNRSSYVPGATVLGIVNGTLPLAVPVVYR